MAALEASPIGAKVLAKLRSVQWRMNNLYWITDKDGNDILFQPNWAQNELLADLHYLNVILKARQLGFSTAIVVFLLDVCLFSRNVSCGLIDATLDDAKAKLAKIKHAYDRLPPWLRKMVPVVIANTKEIRFANGSSITAGVSHRGGTLQYLHISEFGKICAKSPERAREIVTGALNTVQAGNFVFVESTAEGQEGRFYEMCQEAQSLARTGRPLTALDYKFWFFPWWREPSYRIDDYEGVPISPRIGDYFRKLDAEHQIKVTPAQRAWYALKEAQQLEDMKREYPATPEEAFEASVEGAIFGRQIKAAEEERRIGAFKAIKGLPVHTLWDIGRRDYTSIWFAQIMVGKVRLVGFYQNCMAELPHYLLKLREMYAENGWTRDGAEDWWPHDGKVTEWGSGRSRIEQGVEGGLNVRIAAQDLALQDSINAARATFPLCDFDAEACAEGLAMLRQYRWDWDDNRGAWKTGTERHDTHSHGAAAFRTLGVSWRDITPDLPEQRDPLAALFHVPTVDEMLAQGESEMAD